jgi:hypothetical protein
MIRITLVLTLAAAFLPAALAQAQEAPSPYLSAEEKAELLKMLDESFDMLLGRISGLTDEQWNFKQNPDRWSVAECTEHIVRSERALLEYAKNAMKNQPDKDWAERTKGKNAFIRQVMPNRNPGGVGGAQAPMEIRPTEKWDRARAFEEVYKVRGEVRGYIETLEGPIKSHTFEHPFPVFGWLNAYDWIIYVPLHTIRHSKQIIEVQEDKNYPKSAKAAQAAGQ